MRAARIVAPGEVRLEQHPVPEPGPTQVLFRVYGCGVSRSAAWEGAAGIELPRPPGESSAEAWGVVQAVGNAVTEHRVGDPMAALCERGLAELAIVDSDAVATLPSELSGAPFPGLALASALNCFVRSRVVAGQLVGIVGVGFLGALLVRLAAQAGARVVGVSRRPFSLTVAREMGAMQVIELGEPRQTVDELVEGTGGLCDTVIEATGAQGGLQVASALVRERGTLVIAGRHRGVRHVDLELWGERGLDVINPHDHRRATLVEGMRSVARAMRRESLDFSSLYTHKYRLEELGAALDAARSRPVGMVKGLVVF
jgi:threonine dehydrogenase-like Zn-dependent dehydrogenase